jgi:hypothetical protein
MAAKKAAPKGKKPGIVVGSKVKESVKAGGVRSAGDLVDALNDKVHELLGSAIARCKANGRGTVRPQDL